VAKRCIARLFGGAIQQFHHFMICTDVVTQDYRLSAIPLSIVSWERCIKSQEV
jgi:hypothetical protein